MAEQEAFNQGVTKVSALSPGYALEDTSIQYGLGYKNIVL